MKWLKCKQCGRVDRSNDDFIGTKESMHCPDCSDDDSGKAKLCRFCCPTWHGTKWFTRIPDQMKKEYWKE